MSKTTDWEIDGEIHVRRKGEKYFTEVDGNKFLKSAIKEAKEEERERVIEKVLSKKRHTFNPVGGISNIEYISVSDIKKLSQQKDE